MTKKEFRQKMKCGLGRCVKALSDDDMLKFKPVVLWGCLNNIAFDTQCEGSRGNYMYELAVRFHDEDYFIKPAAEKFLNSPVDMLWHKFCHLCDFLQCFAKDGNSAARQALKDKYNTVYSSLMNTRESRKARNILENYEYICIDILQIMQFEIFLKIAEDIGSYFIKRRADDNENLKWLFGWFYSKACEKFGAKRIRKELEKESASNEKISRFLEVMEYTDFKKTHRAKPVPVSADETIKKAENGLSLKDIIAVRRSENDIRTELAEAVISENDPDKKAEMLKIFRSRYYKFPLDPQPLIGYAVSENEKLRTAALDVLAYTEGKSVHDFAVKLLEEEENTAAALSILINNYEKADKTLLMSALKNIRFDHTDNNGWHGIVIDIINAGGIEVTKKKKKESSPVRRKGSAIPAEALMFVYEKSLCSCCRESVLKIMGRRRLLTKEILNECLFDCNSDIRRYAEKRLKRL